MTTKNRFKKFICILLMIAMVLSAGLQAVPAFALTEAPLVDINNGVTIDSKTGTVVYKKDETVKIAPGGMTKIMTAVVAVEKGELSATARTQVNSMLLEGNNESALELANGVFGDQAQCLAAMNAKAQSLGCVGTSFTSVTGYTTDENHYTTMADMGKILKAFMDKKELKEIATMKAEGKSKVEFGKFLSSTNDNDIKVSGIIGKKDGSEFATLALGGVTAEDNEADNKKLINYAFENYRTYQVLKKDKSIDKIKIKGGQKTYVKAYAKENLYVTLPAEGSDELVKTEVVVNENLKAPIEKNQVVGKIQALEAGEVTAEVDLIVKESVGKGGPWSKIGISDTMMVALCGGLAIILLLTLIVALKIRKRKKKIVAMKKKRREEEALRIARERAEKRRRDWPY